MLTATLLLIHALPDIFQVLLSLSGTEWNETSMQIYRNWMWFTELILVGFLLRLVYPVVLQPVLGLFLVVLSVYVMIELHEMPTMLLSAVGISDVATRKEAIEVVSPTFQLLYINLFLLFIFLYQLSSVLGREGKKNVEYVTRFIYPEGQKAPVEVAGETENSKQEIFRKHWEKLLQDPESTYRDCLNLFCDYLEASVGVLYKLNEEVLSPVATYAYYGKAIKDIQYTLGDGMVGQVALTGEVLQTGKLPEGTMQVVSGIGSTPPSYLTIIPIKNQDAQVVAVLEVGTFTGVTQDTILVLEDTAVFWDTMTFQAAAQ
ncbi:hypothetical protein GCM10023331_24500 [Algivirga pacifica]|uniref:GAF domain-containing protein n=2 Tax=Algivirga pacifica TaxID=1162670 RepID=A0ABP9DFC2_9BACT